MSQYKTVAITDKYTLETIAKDLKSKSEAYYIMFKILLDTGMPLDELAKMRVCDINKNAITFMPIHKGNLRTEPLSESTQEDIRNYVKDKQQGDFAFPSKSNPQKPMFIRSFQYALLESSRTYGIEPPVSATSLKKTYIYNLFMETHDTKKIYKITGIRSLVQLYEFFGIEAPPLKGDDETNHSSRTPYNILVGENLAENTKEHFNEVFDKLTDTLRNPQQSSKAYCYEALAMINQVEKALGRFENLSEDLHVAKTLYKKSGDAE